MVTRLQGVAAPDINEATADHADASVTAASSPTGEHDRISNNDIHVNGTAGGDQVTTQDVIVAQEVTTDSVAQTLDSTGSAPNDSADSNSEQSSAQESKSYPNEQDSAPQNSTVQESTARQPDSHESDAHESDPLESDTVWEDALHSLPAPQRPLQRLLPMTTRFGVLGLVAVAMWWTWPRGDMPVSWVEDAQAGDVSSLAIVNPSNVQYGVGIAARVITPTPDTTTQEASFDNIVVVTPTSVQGTEVQLTAESNQPGDGNTQVDGELEDEPIILEASAAVTHAQEDAIVIEIPMAETSEPLMPALEAEPNAAEAQTTQTEIILVPTATPMPTPQAVSALSAQSIPKVEIVPALGAKATPTEQATEPTPTATVPPTATPPPVGPGRLWSTFTPLPAAESDHFWIENPFENVTSNRFASPSYQFGATAGNRYRPHHGLDFSNPTGTPVQAGVEGEVVHAGPDDPNVLGPYADFYGKAVVIRLDKQLPVAGGQLDVFVLYGHLSDVHVEVGQHVQPTEVVGLVGMTGIAIGPHLHVEVRLGANTYDHSVNPYLWLKPTNGHGAVAVRLLTANGRTWAGEKVSIARFEGGTAVWGRQIETYLDTENIGPDPLWGENGAMGDVPAGSYVLIANINGENIRANFTVNAGETTFVEIRTEQ